MTNMSKSLSKVVALVGLDVGTTNVKAAAYDRSGSVLAASSRRLPVIEPRPGWAEYDPEVLFDTAASVVREVLVALPTEVTVAAVAVASMAETAVPLGPQGEILHHAIAWFDERTTQQVAWWRESVGAERIYQITGLPVLPIFGIHKLLWLKQNEPDVYRKTRSWLNVADYIAYRLCGVQATDLSLASRLMVLDLQRRAWSTELLAACEVPADLLAELVPSGQALGYVHDEGHKATGLPTSAQVVAGGHDHPCGAFGLGITEPGDLLDSMGTSEALYTVIKAPKLLPDLAHIGYQQGCHVAPGTYYGGGGLFTSGACTEWLRKLLGLSAESGHAELASLAESAPLGSGGVFFLPHLQMANPPIDDMTSRGAFIGLSSSTDRACVARAVLEGLAYEAHFSSAGLAHHLDLRLGRVRAIGGGARNALLMRMKASLLGRAIEVIQVEEAGSLGAAMLAGLGAGVYADVADAVREVRLEAILVEPDPAWQAYYQQAFEQVFKRIYPQLAPLSRAIRELPRSE